MQTAAQDMPTRDGLNELVAEQDQSLSEPTAVPTDSETPLVV